jgi:hypothetical protein
LWNHLVILSLVVWKCFTQRRHHHHHLYYSKTIQLTHYIFIPIVTPEGDIICPNINLLSQLIFLFVILDPVNPGFLLLLELEDPSLLYRKCRCLPKSSRKSCIALVSVNCFICDTWPSESLIFITIRLGWPFLILA